MVLVISIPLRINFISFINFFVWFCDFDSPKSQKPCKKNDKTDCKVIQENSPLGQEIKLAILKKAALIEDGERSKDPEYSETGPGRPDGND